MYLKTSDGCNSDYIEFYENSTLNNSSDNNLITKKILDRICGQSFSKEQKTTYLNELFIHFVIIPFTYSEFKMILTATFGFFL